MGLSGRPAEHVLEAFGVAGEVVWLPGGQAWRAGRVVVKSVGDLAETVWRAGVLDGLAGAGVRVARPVRATSGEWVVEGWEASEFVEGAADVRRADDEVRAGIAFHAAVAGLDRPGFLDRRDGAYVVADRVAWGEVPVAASEVAAELLGPLLEVWRPVEMVSQVVHGDLPGNVLFAEGQAPAVIDWAVYWRPAEWAAAVVVADALCWYGGEPALIERWAHLSSWDQMLVRALIYRIVIHDELFGAAGWTPDHVDAYRLVVELVVAFHKTAA
ncbi:TIGR02569 family protein [Actinokineospora globicatena]|uniref:TIGR02569 family protein n=1 Tax=Actinokineospora globicatena TaxID=103729 RepID=UPI0020A5E612|nr:TIGR02569 family protein [Actinokineospora globicatena]MCP2303072.1 TIGR02569 family protein [Actinokineospora globicatena]GLW79815.1 TIGR02569 family protein [Actinokineospora globicatena]GLW85775.1 TIGR02569 family protein [Actinokineospora globicatena]